MAGNFDVHEPIKLFSDKELENLQKKYKQKQLSWTKEQEINPGDIIRFVSWLSEKGK